MLIHHAAAHLERVGQLAVVHGEGVRQQYEALYLLVVGKVLLQRFNALGVELYYGRVCA